MIHRMTLASNPRLIVFFTIMAALPIAGVATFSYFPALAAGAATALGCWLSYSLYRFAKPYLSTHINTADAEVTFLLPGEGAVTFSWKEIDLAGRCVPARGKPFLFVYHSGRDKLITIPFEYQDMKGLEAELEEKTPFETFRFEPGSSLHTVLKERFPRNLPKEE